MRKLLLLWILFVAISCKTPTNNPNIQVLAVPQFTQKMQSEDVQLIDVRTAEEYANGHIEKAQNIDVTQEEFTQEIQHLDKTKPVMVYCHSGKRSQKASNILSENGFTIIIDLDGGYSAWEKEKN